MKGPPPGLVRALGDRYAVIREIGAGGMATVYLAQDHKHGRQVAVKMLRPELAEILGTERFLREIEIAASLTHPHILPLHDSGGEDGVLYYVMPFIEGESLRERLSREGRLPVPDALRIFHQIVDALGAAHGRGVVHRDIKPANILLTGNHALVADFGVAKALIDVSSDSRLTTVGVSMGTPHYMAPEQAAADPESDHRADLFAAGAVAYEMLTGRAPFDGENTRAVLMAVLTTTPEPPRQLRPDVPGSISDLVMWCLEKDPKARPQSAQDLLARLETAYTPAAGVLAAPGISRDPARRRVLLGAGVAVLVLLALAGWRWNQQRGLERWARQEGLPEVIRLVDSNRLTEAAELAEDVEAVLGSDPVLEPLWPRMTSPFRIATEPAGATVTYREYESDGEWRSLGTSPFESDRFPVGAYRFRIELDGFAPIERARSLIPADLVSEIGSTGFDYLADPSYVIDEVMWRAEDVPDVMLPVRGGFSATISVLGFGPIDPVHIPDYLIQRTEVTNGQYKEFVDAGGYTDETVWADSFIRDGESLGFAQAVGMLTDATGRPGPAAWNLGEPRDGSQDLPVSGVSWYEADAYCRWKGWSLPTMYHWARAALPSSDVWIAFNTLLARASNFGDGPVPVGSRDAMGISGAHDLGGNAREWSLTEGDGDRMSMGGGWSDPVYWLHDSFSAPAWSRGPTEGFRCAVYGEGGPPDHLTRPFDLPEQDLTSLATMSDESFRTRQQFVSYDRTAPLGATVESTRDWDWGGVEEWVTINTAYGDRMPVRINLPVGHDPPYPAIIFMNGGNTLRSAEMEDPRSPLPQLIRSGVAVVEPAWDGTYQRNDGTIVARLSESAPQVLANWVKDLGRTIDYLEERPDIDANRVSWLGISLGATIAPRLLPLEPRLRAAVLYSGGIGRTSNQTGVDEITSLAHRTVIPVLMLGGRNDFHLPEANAEAMFRAFGTPDSLKTLRLFDSGHWPLPMGEVLRETVDFLDAHVGPSER